MPNFEYSQWDGSQQFDPQSADAAFDHLGQYLLQYGDEVLDSIQDRPENQDVLDLLIREGYLEKDEEGRYQVTPKGLRRIQSKALEELFDVSRRDKLGRHETAHRGAGQTVHEEWKPYEYGDPVANLNLQETLRNALSRQARSGSLRQGTGKSRPVDIDEDDLVVYDTEYQTSCATVVLLDMSGSMSRYGKFGTAKQVALGLQSLVRSKYQGDFLQVVGFYTYASALTERQLIQAAPKPVSIYDSRVNLRVSLDHPPRFVPEHFTNIQAGLQFARRILKRQPAANKQIITITDGEPTAHIEGREVVLIYPPSEKTARITLSEVQRCANEGLHLSSFALVENEFYLELVNFVEQMAAVSGGIAAYCGTDNLGRLVLESFTRGRRQRRTL